MIAKQLSLDLNNFGITQCQKLQSSILQEENNQQIQQKLDLTVPQEAHFLIQKQKAHNPSDSICIMQVQTLHHQGLRRQMQISPKNSIISRKSCDKSHLRRQIAFLKEQVNRLKIQNLNQKISHRSESRNLPLASKNSNQRYKESNQNIIPPQPYQKNKESILMDKLNDSSICQVKGEKASNQPFVYFRVGRIVKNNPNIKYPLRQSKTIQVRRSINNETILSNQPSNSLLSIQNKNSDTGSEQLFKTIQSRQQFALNDEWQAFATLPDQNKPLSNWSSKQIQIDQEKKGKLPNFNDTFQSSKLSICNNYTKNNSKFSNIVSLINKKKQQSSELSIADVMPVMCQTKPDRINLSDNFVNLGYHSQLTQELGRERNINIRRISFKVKKENKGKNISTFIPQQQIHSHKINLQNANLLQNCYPMYRQDQQSIVNDKLTHQRKTTRNLTSSAVNQPPIFQPASDGLSLSLNQIPNSNFSLSQIPFLPNRPHQKSNQEEIIQMTLRLGRKLKIDQIKRQALEGILIKKFKNCLIFKIPESSKKIIWYYEGRLYYGEGDREGEQGYKSGQGIQYIPGKSFYKGQFLYNKKQGSGTIVNAQGDIYEGQWSKGHYYGKGKLYDSQSKQIYQGEFKGGKYDGFGILKISQSQVYKGTFVRSVKQGCGIQLFKNGDKYKGQYQQGKFNGKGTYLWSNGSIYIGKFVMGIRTGFGQWRSLNEGGDVYVGMYLNDRKHGIGRYCWGDGSVFEGYFQKDQKHGEGFLTYKESERVHGRWQNNKLVQVVEKEQQQEDYSLDKESLGVKLEPDLSYFTADEGQEEIDIE